MLKIVVGAVFGLVLGVVVGATVVAPRLEPRALPAPEFPQDFAGPSVAPAPAVNAGVQAKPSASVLLEPASRGRPTVRWRMASAFPAEMPLIGTLAKRVESEVWKVSGGRVEIRFHEPGALADPSETLLAVSTGAIEAAFSSPLLWGDQAPALRLFGAVPFGPGIDARMAWFYEGGGRRIYEELYAKRNVHALLCGAAAPEASGWFKTEIETLEDLNGKRIAIDGLAAKVLAKLGALPLRLDEGELFVKLESGSIDGAERSLPAVDRKLGLQKFLKHYYFPGWQQPSTAFELLVNLDRWSALSSTQKAQIESVCGDNLRFGLSATEAAQFPALKDLYADGVKLHRWPEHMLESLEKAWDEVVAEEAAANADFRRVWQSLSEFRKEYAIWQDLGKP